MRACAGVSEAAGGTVERIVFCPHGPDDGCDCRKPAPGLLLRLLKSLRVDASRATFVGDSLRDIEAARSASVLPLLVRTGNGRAAEPAAALPDGQVFDDLAGVADKLIAECTS